MSHGGAREKDRYQGARWARREQKLSGKRRINSRHAAASQAYAPQTGTTSTQLVGGEGAERVAWTCGKGMVGLLRLTAARLEPGVDSPSDSFRYLAKPIQYCKGAGQVREERLTTCPRHGLWWKTRAPDLDI